jgi:hypothetical protein
MKTMTDIEAFKKMRDAIFAERESLIQRLREIDESLGAMGLSKARYLGLTTPTGRARNETSLKELVLKVLEGGKSLTKHEILDEVMKRNYSFSSTDPLNSLGVVIYSKKNGIKNEHGKFSLTAKAAKKSVAKKAGAKPEQKTPEPVAAQTEQPQTV